MRRIVSGGALGEDDSDGDILELLALGEAPGTADVQQAAASASTTRPTTRILGRGTPLGVRA